MGVSYSIIIFQYILNSQYFYPYWEIDQHVDYLKFSKNGFSGKICLKTNSILSRDQRR